MSDKNMGVIGQKYENRKSKKVGLLMDRDDESKKLAFLTEEGEPFSVSYSAFKSNWRKFAESDVTEAANEEVNEEVEPSAVVFDTTDTAVNFKTDEEKVFDYITTLTVARDATVTTGDFGVVVEIEGVTVFKTDKTETGYTILALPDIITYSSLSRCVSMSNMHFNTRLNGVMCVKIDNVDASIGDILQIIKCASLDINLYGYKND